MSNDAQHGETPRSDLELALALADAADAVTLPRFRAADLSVETKPDTTPVTDADLATEDRLRALLAAHRGGDAVAGEERGGAVSAGRAWLIDPIDGTKNFSRGLPVWATLIALLHDGVPILGVASAPALGVRWWAATGHGAWRRDHAGAGRIGVSGVAALGDAYVSTTNLAEFPQPEAYLALLAACWESRALGDFWQHCLVAEGALDIAVDPVASAWDLAVPAVLVTEAGGRFTALDGTESHDAGSGLSTNGLLHEEALRLLRS
ncbi:MAG: inositol monophosphatase family protein [Sciscionella sp.]